MSIWSKRRQFTYLASIALVVIVVAVGLFFILKPRPSCFDGKQNGNETGVDCGGACEQVCLVGVLPLRTAWIRVFSVTPGSYYVVASVENSNSGIGIKHFSYTIRLTDADGLLVTTRRGETFVNPREKFLIFEGGIDTGERVATRASITFDSDVTWRRVEAERPSVLVEKRSFTNDSKPRLEVNITNDSIYQLRDIRVPVVLSDRNGNVFAGSSTIVDRLAKNETKTIVYTWPAPFAEVPSAIDVYPRVSLFDLP